MPDKSPLGRAAVTAVFAVLVGYCALAVVGSLLRDLYGQPPPPAESGLSAAERSWCVRRIRALRNDIESHATQFLQKPEPKLHARWKGWNDEWGRELQEIEARCSGRDATLHAAYERLAELHQVYGDAVAGVMRARTELAQQMSDLLQRL